MEKEQQETLLQTIRANIERNEMGECVFVPDENGKWDIVSLPEKKAPLVKFFTPNYVQGFDKFGNPVNT